MRRFRLGLATVALILCTAAPGFADPTFAPGSRAGLELPDGYTAAEKFSGFVNRPQGASILINEFPAVAYAQITEGATDEALAGRGIIVEERRDLEVPAGPAVLIIGSQQAAGITFRKWILIVGAPDVTAMLTVQIPEGAAPEQTSAIEAALATVQVRAELSLDDQLAQLPFRLGVVEPMRIVRVAAGSSVILTRGPKDVVQAAGQPVLIVVSALNPPAADADIETLARATFDTIAGHDDKQIETAAPAQVAGGDGFEILGSGKHDGSGQPVALFQHMRLIPEGYIRIVGIAHPDTSEADIAMFRSISEAVEPR